MSLRYLKALFTAAPTWDTPTEFALLLTLAYYTNDGEGGLARPAQRGLARRLRMAPRSVRRLIADLEQRGLIKRVEHGRGRRASRYLLPLLTTAREDLQVLSERTPRSSLGTSTRQPSARREDSRVSSERTPKTPLRGPGSPPISTDQYRSGISTAPAARFSERAREPNEDNYRPILAIASGLLETHPEFATESEFGAFIEATKQQCAEKRIDYGGGQHPDVPHNIVHRACASAQVARLKRRTTTSAAKGRGHQR